VQFQEIFLSVAEKAGLTVFEEDYNCFIEELTKRGGKQLACYIPSFVVDQVLCACKFEDTAPKLRKDLVVRAIGNLFAEPSVPFESLAVTEQLAKAVAAAEDPAETAAA
jgi:hypothetical protein